MKNRVNGFLCEKNGSTGGKPNRNHQIRPRGGKGEVFRQCILSISNSFVAFCLELLHIEVLYIGEGIPLNFPITSLRVSPKHVITRGHAHIKRTAGVASSSSHHHHHHAHVCGERCQNAVLDVKSKCASPSSRETTTFLDADGHEERQKQQQQYYGETRVDFNRPSLR